MTPKTVIVTRASQGIGAAVDNLFLDRAGGGVTINVLSDVTWRPIPTQSAYSASKAASWSFANTLRVQLKQQRMHVLALHMGFVDTDLIRGLDVPKSSPAEVVRKTLDGLAAGKLEVLADEPTRPLKRGLCLEQPSYFGPAQPGMWP
jgi:short-subunit dehydrogenase